MSNTFYGSSLSETQVERLQNTKNPHFLTHKYTDKAIITITLPYPSRDYVTCQSKGWLSISVDTHTDAQWAMIVQIRKKWIATADI